MKEILGLIVLLYIVVVAFAFARFLFAAGDYFIAQQRFIKTAEEFIDRVNAVYGPTCVVGFFQEARDLLREAKQHRLIDKLNKILTRV